MGCGTTSGVDKSSMNEETARGREMTGTSASHHPDDVLHGLVRDLSQACQDDGDIAGAADRLRATLASVDDGGSADTFDFSPSGISKFMATAGFTIISE